MSLIRPITTIAVRSASPQVGVRATHPEVKLEQQGSQLDIAIEGPRIELDLSEPLGEMGLKRSLTLERAQRDRAQKAALAGTAQRAQEGDRLLAVHEGIRIAEEAAGHSAPDPKEANVALIPTTPVKVKASGHVAASIRPGRVELEVVYGKVALHTRQQGRVDIETQTRYERVHAVDVYR